MRLKDRDDVHLTLAMRDVVVAAMKDSTTAILFHRTEPNTPEFQRYMRAATECREAVHTAAARFSDVVTQHFDIANAVPFVERLFNHDNVVAHAQLTTLFAAMRVDTYEEAMMWAEKIGARTA